MTTDSVRIPGVHVIPIVLSKLHIKKILSSVHKNSTSHHGDEEHGGHGSGEEEEETPRMFRADKPYHLPWVAKLIYPHIPSITVNGRKSVAVDELMQIYTLHAGAGIVPPHKDEDFDGPKQTRALCSIIIRLDENYEGGETVFLGDIPAPHTEVGGGLLFRHDILHEGRQVLSGVKYVLKTDLLFQ